MLESIFGGMVRSLKHRDYLIFMIGHTLAALGRYPPTQVSIEADSGFLAALQQVGEAIQLEHGANMIDVTPDRPSLQANATDIALTD